MYKIYKTENEDEKELDYMNSDIEKATTHIDDIATALLEDLGSEEPDELSYDPGKEIYIKYADGNSIQYTLVWED